MKKNSDGQSLLDDVKAIAGNIGIEPSRAFLYWYATNVLGMDDGSANQAMSIDGANDKGVDLIYVDAYHDRIQIVQGKFSPTLTHNPKPKELHTFLSCLNWLENPKALRAENLPELADFAEDYVEAKKAGYSVELHFVYCGEESKIIEKEVRVFNQNPDNIEGNRSARSVSLKNLLAYYQELASDQTRIASDSVELVGALHETSGPFGRALVGTVKGKELQRLHEEHGDRLFDRNVRLFLGTRKGSVNAGIASTLADSQQQKNFWAYNNGVTILCGSFRAQPPKKGAQKIALENFSIVNGGQTTVSLANCGTLGEEATVLVRCIASRKDTVINNIIRFTNSQNPIRTWDIASQSKTQKRLRTDFEKLTAPVLYVTRRADRPAEDLKKYRDQRPGGGIGKLRKIDIDVLGQYLCSYSGEPVFAYQNKADLFLRRHDEFFRVDLKTLEALFIWRCGELISEAIRKHRKVSPEDHKLLKHRGDLFLLAIVGSLLKQENDPSFIDRANEKMITSKKTLEKLNRYIEVALQLYIGATREELKRSSKTLLVLLRQNQFFESIRDKVLRDYKVMRTMTKTALPKLFIGTGE